MIRLIKTPVSTYDEVLALQHSYFDPLLNHVRFKSAHQPAEALILCQHTPTVTLGRNANPANILVTPDTLLKMGITLVKTDRGGDVTCHEPGQLVAYPIINLHRRNLSVSQYVALLQQIVIDTLSHFDISSHTIADAPGVWISPADNRPLRKICALGLKCSRSVVMHGIALNVSNTLATFQLINPCGFRGGSVTSVCLESPRPNSITIDSVADIFAEHFLKTIGQ